MANGNDSNEHTCTMHGPIHFCTEAGAVLVHSNGAHSWRAFYACLESQGIRDTFQYCYCWSVYAILRWFLSTPAKSAWVSRYIIGILSLTWVNRICCLIGEWSCSLDDTMVRHTVADIFTIHTICGKSKLSMFVCHDQLSNIGDRLHLAASLSIHR